MTSTIRIVQPSPTGQRKSLRYKAEQNKAISQDGKNLILFAPDQVFHPNPLRTFKTYDEAVIAGPPSPTPNHRRHGIFSIESLPTLFVIEGSGIPINADMKPEVLKSSIDHLKQTAMDRTEGEEANIAQHNDTMTKVMLIISGGVTMVMMVMAIIAFLAYRSGSSQPSKDQPAGIATQVSKK